MASADCSGEDRDNRNFRTQGDAKKDPANNKASQFVHISCASGRRKPGTCGDI